MTTATETPARPILFSGPMVRAILDGRKTQTRRVVKMPPAWVRAGLTLDGARADANGFAPGGYLHVPKPANGTTHRLFSPYGYAGDQLWVRESARVASESRGGGCDWYSIEYKAGGPSPTRRGLLPGRWFPANSRNADGSSRWAPGIHMPRWASRLTLELTDVRAERLQEITEADAIAEGVTCAQDATSCGIAREHYHDLRASLNAKRGYGWTLNAWVWVLSFRRADA